MWYFLEKDGRAIAKSKGLYSMKLAYLTAVRQDIAPNRLRITDSYGRIIPLSCPPSLVPFLPKPPK